MSTAQSVGLASTYKATLCPHYASGGDGVCPDGPYCRNAHGEHDIRTREQNEADGIVNEMGLYKYLTQLEQAAAAAAPPAPAAAPAAAVAAAVAANTPSVFNTDAQSELAVGSGAPLAPHDTSTVSFGGGDGGDGDMEEDVVFRLLSALDGEAIEDENRTIDEAKRALRSELVKQMSVCGIPVPAFLLMEPPSTY